MSTAREYPIHGCSCERCKKIVAKQLDRAPTCSPRQYEPFGHISSPGKFIPVDKKPDAYLSDKLSDFTFVKSPAQAEPPEHDPVSNPAHYTWHPSGVEQIEISEHMTYNLGTAIKYIWRCHHKGKTIEDLEKAIFLLAREIKRIEDFGDDS